MGADRRSAIRPRTLPLTRVGYRGVGPTGWLSLLAVPPRVGTLQREFFGETILKSLWLPSTHLPQQPDPPPPP